MLKKKTKKCRICGVGLRIDDTHKYVYSRWTDSYYCGSMNCKRKESH